MIPGLSSVIKGAQEAAGEFNAIPGRANRAVAAAVRKVERKIVTSVRANMGGKPRWNHRGRSRIYAEPVNLGGAEHAPRGGGPGVFTGKLRKGVGGSRPTTLGNTTTAWVGIGGSRMMENNLKKRYLEEKYPFFEPGVKAAEGGLTGIYESALDAALKRRGGL
jgi:hypothetical protein